MSQVPQKYVLLMHNIERDNVKDASYICNVMMNYWKVLHSFTSATHSTRIRSFDRLRDKWTVGWSL